MMRGGSAVVAWQLARRAGDLLVGFDDAEGGVALASLRPPGASAEAEAEAGA